MNNLASLENIIAPAVEALGYVLWGCVISHQGKQVVLRVYIDKFEGGVNVDDCAKASHQINGVLAINNAITGNYILEVSSPGLERTLFKHSQYEQYKGQKIKLRLRVPVERQRNFQGILKEVHQDSISMSMEGNKKEKMSFKFSDIEHAHLLSDVGCERKGAKR